MRCRAICRYALRPRSLAVSGMRSASEELIMAGNEQYRQNAFQGAEAGIELPVPRGALSD